MQFHSVLTLIFLACSLSVRALLAKIEFEVEGHEIVHINELVESRDTVEFDTRNMTVSNEIRQLAAEIRADMLTRDLILHPQARDVKKAGEIMDKVSLALTPVSAAGPVGIAVAVVKTAVKIFSAVLQAIGKAQHKDALKRGAFTQDFVNKTLQKHPCWNCVVVHTKHKKNFKGKEGQDWAHEHQELKVKFPVGSTIGFEIYTFREGTFELLGDGGYLNWAFGGQAKRDGKKVTFTASGAAKGAARDAAKGTGKEVANGKKSKGKKKKSKK